MMGADPGIATPTAQPEIGTCGNGWGSYGTFDWFASTVEYSWTV